jgi:hypothetical protein
MRMADCKGISQGRQLQIRPDFLRGEWGEMVSGAILAYSTEED